MPFNLLTKLILGPPPRIYILCASESCCSWSALRDELAVTLLEHFLPDFRLFPFSGYLPLELQGQPVGSFLFTFSQVTTAFMRCRTLTPAQIRYWIDFFYYSFMLLHSYYGASLGHPCDGKPLSGLALKRPYPPLGRCQQFPS